MPRMNRWPLLLFACIAGAVLGQPNGILLVAKPGLPDPNFSEAVVLVARTDDDATVGACRELRRNVGGRCALRVPGVCRARGPRWAGIRLLPGRAEPCR